MPNKKREKRGIILFVILVLSWSWPIFFITDAWLIPELLQSHQKEKVILVAIIGHILAMLGPAISATLVWKFYYKEGLNKWNWGKAKDYISAFFFMFFLWSIPALLGVLFWKAIFFKSQITTIHWIASGIYLFFGWLAGIGEEKGWCWFLLSRLSPITGKTKAIVIAGVIRGIWHLPIFIGPALYLVFQGEGSLAALFLKSIVFVVQLSLSNIFFQGLFSYFWYKTKSIPFLGWMHLCFDITRDIATLFIAGYAASFWYKYGWALPFYGVAYYFFEKIFKEDGYPNFFNIFWKSKLATHPK